MNSNPFHKTEWGRLSPPPDRLITVGSDGIAQAFNCSRYSCRFDLQDGSNLFLRQLSHESKVEQSLLTVRKRFDKVEDTLHPRRWLRLLRRRPRFISKMAIIERAILIGENSVKGHIPQLPRIWFRLTGVFFTPFLHKDFLFWPDVSAGVLIVVLNFCVIK